VEASDQLHAPDLTSYELNTKRNIFQKLIVTPLVKKSPPPHALVQQEISLPYLQEPATGPCSESNESSTQLPTDFPKIHSNIILPSMPMVYAFLISPMRVTCHQDQRGMKIRGKIRLENVYSFGVYVFYLVYNSN